MTGRYTIATAPTGAQSLLEMVVNGPDLSAGLCLKGDADLWHSDDIFDQMEAKRICGECPVREACLTNALDRKETHGVWGGTDERERRKLLGKTIQVVQHKLRTITCRNCREDFTVAAGNAAFCKPECRKQWHRNQQNGTPKCLDCGTNIDGRGETGRCQKCATKVVAQTRQTEFHITCEWCKKPATIGGPGNYCSRRCKQAAFTERHRYTGSCTTCARPITRWSKTGLCTRCSSRTRKNAAA